MGQAIWPVAALTFLKDHGASAVPPVKREREPEPGPEPNDRPSQFRKPHKNVYRITVTVEQVDPEL